MTALHTETHHHPDHARLLVDAADVTDIEQVRAARAASAKQRRAAARTRDLTALLRERPDLIGVHAPADLTVDAVRWCV
jgi:glyoxylase-like metal-dependent hydrolase (beta-lactamase superfamily II)